MKLPISAIIKLRNKSTIGILLHPPSYAMQYRIKQLQEIIINTFTCIMQSWLIDSAIFEK